MIPIAFLLTQSTVATALIFVKSDSPVYQKYIPELKKLHSAYKSKVLFQMVYADVNTDEKSVLARHNKLKVPFKFAFDPVRRVTNIYKVTMEPTVIVVTNRRKILYTRRIDDAYLGNNKWQTAKTHELKDALIAASNGTVPKVTNTVVAGKPL